MLRPMKNSCTMVLVLILSLTIVFDAILFPSPVVSGETAPVKKPEARLSPEIPIESEGKKDTGWFEKYKWWVALGGAMLVGTAAALLASGDSDEGGGSGEDDGAAPTEYRINW